MSVAISDSIIACEAERLIKAITGIDSYVAVGTDSVGGVHVCAEPNKHMSNWHEYFTSAELEKSLGWVENSRLRPAISYAVQSAHHGARTTGDAITACANQEPKPLFRILDANGKEHPFHSGKYEFPKPDQTVLEVRDGDKLVAVFLRPAAILF